MDMKASPLLAVFEQHNMLFASKKVNWKHRML